ncbi:MAG: hypothetical protein JW741_15640 [Sedimentisphaerales bacterium]|nr:hypothetical protein [Sedimentisphaerales bacterium]
MKQEERAACFGIGFLRAQRSEHLFLSVTPGFEHGPGILRDGITAPRMTDPHHVAYVLSSHNLSILDDGLRHHTEEPFLQRSGTWTIYHHLKKFHEFYGSQWRIIACQSCGDLTMNPWHMAYIGRSHLPGMAGKLCALRTAEDRDDQWEHVEDKVYRCLVKWRPQAARVIGSDYEFLDLRFFQRPKGIGVGLSKQTQRNKYHTAFKKQSRYDSRSRDISHLIEFALSGKPIAESGLELDLSNSIDKFQDIRHIFKIPTVPCRGNFRGEPVSTINFGEYQLYHNLNERRAALQTPVLIDLNIGNQITTDWTQVRNALLANHFRETQDPDAPTSRGHFRRYPNSEKVEIFYPHNVYPFGVLGLGPVGLVCLASGGLSGRVGNTLEGTTRIMYDFFGCEDAIVLDEGYDTFHLVNPAAGKGVFKYSNTEMLSTAYSFTREQLEKDFSESEQHDGKGMWEWPLNQEILKTIKLDRRRFRNPEPNPDILVVPPRRSQIRCVIIFASRESAKGKGRRSASTKDRHS